MFLQLIQILSLNMWIVFKNNSKRPVSHLDFRRDFLINMIGRAQECERMQVRKRATCSNSPDAETAPKRSKMDSHVFRKLNVHLPPYNHRQACMKKTKRRLRRVKAWAKNSKRRCVMCSYLVAKKKAENRVLGRDSNHVVPEMSKSTLGCSQ